MSEEKQQAIGEELSAARQERGLDLEEVQRQSGISLFILENIEADKLDAVEPVFVRLALKAYADFLDLDPEPLLTRFDQRYGRVMQSRSQPLVILEQPTPRRSRKPLIITSLVIGACCVLALALFYFLGDKQPPAQTSSAPTQTSSAPTQTPSTPIQTPAAVAQSQPTATPSDSSVQASTEPEAATQTTEPAPVVLELEARDSTWVQIRWDDAAENFEAIVPPGERHRFEARDHFIVLSTRPHGLIYWLDGQLLGNGQFGDPSQVLHFRAAANGIEFLKLDSQPSAGEAPAAQP